MTCPFAIHLPRQPMWAIPIHIALSLALGTALTLLLEEPARKSLRLVYRGPLKGSGQVW